MIDFNLPVPSPVFTPVPLAEFFRDVVIPLYKPPIRSKTSYVSTKRVIRTLAAHPEIRSTADLTPEVITRLGAEWEGSDSMRRDFLNTLHRICNIAVARRHLAFNPFPCELSPSRLADLPCRRRGRTRLVRVPEPSEVERLITHLHERSDTWKGYRLYALVASVVSLGLLRGETFYQKSGDCDLERSIITLSHGRRRSLVLTIPTELRPILAGWLPLAGPHWLFPGRSKFSPWTTDKEDSGARHEIRQAGLAVGIERLTFESLRHFGKARAGQSGPGDPPRLSDYVILDGPDGFPLILGKPHPKLVRMQRPVLARVCEAFPGGVSLPELEAICPGARGVLRGLRDKEDLNYRFVLHPAETPHGKGYRIGPPRINRSEQDT